LRRRGLRDDENRRERGEDDEDVAQTHASTVPVPLKNRLRSALSLFEEAARRPVRAADRWRGSGGTGRFPSAWRHEAFQALASGPWPRQLSSTSSPTPPERPPRASSRRSKPSFRNRSSRKCATAGRRRSTTSTAPCAVPA